MEKKLSFDEIDTVLQELYFEEHGILGQFLADKNKNEIEQNWQGGRVNGINHARTRLRMLYGAN